LPNGNAAVVEGTASPAGDKFFVESVGVLQPVVITLVAKNPGDKLKLTLGKQRWDEDLRHAETGADNIATLKLRTQGEVRMTVTGDADKPYNLIVWVGDEVKPDFDAAPAVTPMTAGAGGGGSGNTAGIVAAVVIGLLLVVVVVYLKRRGAK